MTSFWNLFILFVVINIPFAFVPLAFDQSPAFDSIDFSNFTTVQYPDALLVDLNTAESCGTSNSTTLIGKLCQEGRIQNLSTNSTETGSLSIVNTQDVGIIDWVDQITDFGQLIVFGVQLLFSAVTGGFIVQVLTSFIFADELPDLFVTGVQVLIGLMWLSFFFKTTLGKQLNPAE
jgi:hypothetical protein